MGWGCCGGVHGSRTTSTPESLIGRRGIRLCVFLIHFNDIYTINDDATLTNPAKCAVVQLMVDGGGAESVLKIVIMLAAR